MNAYNKLRKPIRHKRVIGSNYDPPRVIRVRTAGKVLAGKICGIGSP